MAESSYKVDTKGYDSAVPAMTLHALVNYVEHRLQVGDFLEGMLTNDLHKAIGYVDEDNLSAIRSIYLFIYNRMPMICHGSPEKMKAWYAREDEHDG